MILLLLLNLQTTLNASAQVDFRADPFEFNPCLWDLRGLEADLSDNLGKATARMASTLSTCDMFFLPGITTNETLTQLLGNFTEKHFLNFHAERTEGAAGTVLSKIVPENVTVIAGTADYPIPQSKCNGAVHAGVADLANSFSLDVQFHDPVPNTRIYSVIFSDASCHVREAQAKLLCDQISLVPSEYDIFVLGSFVEDVTEPYAEILAQCGLSHTNRFKSPKKEHPTNTDGKASEHVFFSNRISSWFDMTMIWATPIENVTKGYPVEVFIHQPLTPRWKKFEIAFSIIGPLLAICVFIFLIYHSRQPSSQTDYQVIN